MYDRSVNPTKKDLEFIKSLNKVNSIDGVNQKTWFKKMIESTKAKKKINKYIKTCDKLIYHKSELEGII